LFSSVLSYASRYLPGNRFLGATSMRRRTAGLEGIHWEAAFLVGVPPLSRVFQVAHVKPANAKNHLISPGRWIFSLSRELRISYGNREKKRRKKAVDMRRDFQPRRGEPFRDPRKASSFCVSTASRN